MPPHGSKSAALRALCDQGLALHQAGHLEEARAFYKKILLRDPKNFDTLYLLAMICAQTDQDALSYALTKRAIAINPNIGVAHSLLGTVLNKLGRREEALASHGRAIRLQPDNAEAYNNRGNVFHEMQRHEEALADFDAAIALNPDYPAPHYNRATSLFELGRCEEALVSFDRALALAPDNADARFNRSVALLQSGRFQAGWREYEWRKVKIPSPAQLDPGRLWLGEPDLVGKHLFVHYEQGMGDTLQFCRYARLLRDKGVHVSLSVQNPLLSLLRQFEPDIQLFAENEAPATFDYHCPLMSLPLAVGTDVSTIPNAVPYIRADPDKAAYWRGRLATRSGPRVGLVWNGGFRADQPELWTVNAQRNMPFDQIAKLNLGEVDYFSLQKGEPAESELLQTRERYWSSDNFYNFAVELVDFSDTAALVENLDLVICVDTATAHLAGAMGKTVWILSRFNGCWRWLRDRADSPWYPTARLFRQRAPGDWTSVIEEARAALRSWVSLPKSDFADLRP
jgi:Flp pilus assembly protein TadD